MNPTVVVHRKELHDVYIGRPGPWGNPFTIVGAAQTENPRAHVIKQFENWMRTSTDEQARWIRAHIHELAGKRLGCYCHPQSCHGDVLARWADIKATERLPPIVRTNDPWSSKLAAQRIQPKRGTRKAAVLQLLADKGGWVDGHEITHHLVGGSEGLRRLRELRTEGHNIQRRPNPNSATSWQYRILP